MADGILGLAGGQASTLNQELIDKLKAAEKKSTVEPLEKALETWDKESEVVLGIEEKFNELYDLVQNFDLYNTSGTVFDQKTASVTGTGALYDAIDIKNLDLGNTIVEVSALAKKDVYQSDSVTEAVKDTAMGAETLTIQIGSNTAIDFDTNGKTYDELAKDINSKTGLSASVEKVGDDSYRLVIKSSETGLENALTISGTASQTLGYTTDGTTVNTANRIQEASNSKIIVDNITYETSSNEITVSNGALKITATEIGTSTLSVQEDNSILIDGINQFVEKYNALNKAIDDAVYGDERVLNETSTMKSILSQIKEKIFGVYGENSDKNISSFGFELAKDGSLSVDSTILNEKIASDPDSIKALFTGTDAHRGIGTQLKELMFDMTLTGGLMKTYGEDLADRKVELTKDKEEATKDLDTKYSAMTARFGEYSAIIARMDASFSGLKMMIEQSVASN